MGPGELLARLESVVGRLEAIGADHETRLRVLEGRMLYAMGAVAVTLAAVPVLLHFVN